ncbi:hypothetical protein DFP92_101503 [Yoonia sediminilitoris]|uniref:Uncharacterized protein n=1 Tax=Yoonia sediminilitoris TaxID=1286148 RepID=A0A2T6KQT1_9RHOB|nr:hypothetical protein C8N45_101503 [Yoonia sediminilitoris]RCW99080.1 hypothetical protein DFP92_101503 [Yoonia sediminilitoris]
MKNLFKCAFCATIIGVSLTPSVSSASEVVSILKDEIVLTLKDRDVSITGEFAGFQQNAYLIATKCELLNVPAKFVDCEGDSCVITLSSNGQD